MSSAMQVAVEPTTNPAPKRRDFGSSARLWGGFLGRAWLWFIAGCLVVTFIPMLFGWRPYVVESGSMQPRIKVGDIILSSPEHDAKKLLGHVTVFKDPEAGHTDTVKSHRVIKINKDGTLETKGDANQSADPTPVPMANVKGIGRLLVRWIGLPLIWVQTGAWLKLGLAVLSLWIAAVLVVRDHDESISDEDDMNEGGTDDGGADGDSTDVELDDDLDELDETDRVADEIPDDSAVSPARWKPRRSGLRLLGRSRHIRTLTKPEIAKMIGVRTAIVTVTAGALLLPTTQAAFSATSSIVGAAWTAAASFARNYTADTQALNPYIYWKLDDSAGTNKNKNTTALDYSGNTRNGLYSPSPYGNANWSMQQPGALTNQTPNLAVGFGGGAGTSVACVTTNAAAENPAPVAYSEIIWFNTTSTQGGKLIGFESAQTGVSNNSSQQYDRHIFMDNAGHVTFGVYPSAGPNANSAVMVTSPKTYNDGKWHMAVATMGTTTGMKLYVDNVVVATNTNTYSQDYSKYPGGYWRVGCGNLQGWGSDFPTQTNYGFKGLLDEATVYTTELSAANINQLWTDINPGSTTPPPPPVPQLVNGDFENGTTGWTGTCASLGAGDPAPHGGTNSLNVTASNGWLGGNVTAQCTQSITLTAGQYTLTTYLYGTNATVALSGAATATQTVNGNSWQLVTVPFTVTASGSVTVAVQTQSGGGFAPASNSVYADDFSITSP